LIPVTTVIACCRAKLGHSVIPVRLPKKNSFPAPPGRPGSPAGGWAWVPCTSSMCATDDFENFPRSPGEDDRRSSWGGDRRGGYPFTVVLGESGGGCRWVLMMVKTWPKRECSGGGKPDSRRPGYDTIDVATLLMHHLPAMTLKDGTGRKILLRSEYYPPRSSGKLRTPGAIIEG
jgi:hypothetical protein